MIVRKVYYHRQLAVCDVFFLGVKWLGMFMVYVREHVARGEVFFSGVYIGRLFYKCRWRSFIISS